MRVSSMLPMMLNMTFMPTQDIMRKKRKIHMRVYLKVEKAAG